MIAASIMEATWAHQTAQTFGVEATCTGKNLADHQTKLEKSLIFGGQVQDMMCWKYMITTEYI